MAVIVDARGEPLELAMQYRPLLVKPNRAELAATFGVAVDSDAQLKEAIRRLIELGAKTALITMGAKGRDLLRWPGLLADPVPQGARR